MKKILNGIDKPLLIVSFILMIFGLLMIYSSSSVSAVLRYNHPSYYFFEKQLIDFLHVKDTAIFPSYNGISADILENILNTEDAIIYDENINPALIRGVRICKADKIRYHHNDMDKLEEALKMTQMRRLRIIVTDGIFYDLGDCANLSAIKKLAEHYNALVLLDDSFGFLTCGKNGHGSDELCGVKNFADIKLINMQNSLCLSNGAIVSIVPKHCGRSSMCPG